MNTFYKAFKSCFSNRKLFQPFASITWQEEKRNVDEMEVTTTKKRYKSLALSFFTLLRLLCVFLFWPPVLSVNVADGLQRSFVALLYVPASRTYFPLRYLSLLVRFLTGFYFMASFFVLFCFGFFHEFFILHFIHHLIYECFYFTEFCSLVVGEICCLSYWTPPGVWCGTSTNRYVMNIFKTICNAVLPPTRLAYNLVDVCGHWLMISYQCIYNTSCASKVPNPF